MTYFKELMFMIYEFLKTPFYIWGYELSLWGILILVCLVSIVFGFVSGLFSS